MKIQCEIDVGKKGKYFTKDYLIKNQMKTDHFQYNMFSGHLGFDTWKLKYVLKNIYVESITE